MPYTANFARVKIAARQFKSAKKKPHGNFTRTENAGHGNFRPSKIAVRQLELAGAEVIPQQLKAENPAEAGNPGKPESPLSPSAEAEGGEAVSPPTASRSRGGKTCLWCPYMPWVTSATRITPAVKPACVLARV